MSVSTVSINDVKYHETFGLVRVLRALKADWVGELIEVEPFVPVESDMEVLSPDWVGESDSIPSRASFYVHPSELSPVPDLPYQDDELYIILYPFEDGDHNIPLYEEFYRLICVMPDATALLAGEESLALREVPVSRVLNVRTGKSPDFDVHHYLFLSKRQKWGRKVTLSEAGVQRAYLTRWVREGDLYRAQLVCLIDGKKHIFPVVTSDFRSIKHKISLGDPLRKAALIQFAVVEMRRSSLTRFFSMSLHRQMLIHASGDDCLLPS